MITRRSRASAIISQKNLISKSICLTFKIKLKFIIQNFENIFLFDMITLWSRASAIFFQKMYFLIFKMYICLILKLKLKLICLNFENILHDYSFVLSSLKNVFYLYLIMYISQFRKYSLVPHDYSLVSVPVQSSPKKCIFLILICICLSFEIKLKIILKTFTRST